MLSAAETAPDQAITEEPIHWYRAGEISSLFADGDCHGLKIDGHPIGLFQVEGEVFALDDICTHGNALLSDGELDGHGIECPLHAGLFDVRNGKVMCSPLTKNTRCHKVKLEDGVAFIASPSQA